MGPSNIVINNGIPIFFDWSDASITHPFFSLLLLFDDSPAALMAPPQQNQRLRAAYLSPWQVYESMERLEQALELAEQLAPVHHALLYHLMILPNMEAKWEMVNMVAYYLRMLLHEYQGEMGRMGGRTAYWASSSMCRRSTWFMRAE